MTILIDIIVPITIFFCFRGMLSPEDMAWNKEANIESLCKVEDSPATNSAPEPAPDVGMS